MARRLSASWMPARAKPASEAGPRLRIEETGAGISRGAIHGRRAWGSALGFQVAAETNRRRTFSGNILIVGAHQNAAGNMGNVTDMNGWTVLDANISYLVGFY